VFVKAVSSGQNEQTPGMHRREGRIAALLNDAAPVPRLLATYDDGSWVGLMYQATLACRGTTPS
jgi:hypothetical protein